MKVYIADQIGDPDEVEAAGLVAAAEAQDGTEVVDHRQFDENGDLHEYYWCNHERVETVYSTSKERAEEHQKRLNEVGNRNRGLRG